MTTISKSALWATGLALAIALPMTAQSAPVEKKDLSISVAGTMTLMNKVPYALALNKGFFQQEGLDVKSTAFAAGAKAMQSLVAGDSDLAEGAYEHTILLQDKQIQTACLVVWGRYPGLVLAINKAEADKIKTPADLKGKKIGVSAPGSSTYDFAAQVLQRAGVSWKDAHYVAVGTGLSAVAAMRNGNELDALSGLDPTITALAKTGDIKIMIDSRTREGTDAAFGGDYLSDCLMAKTSFIKEHPKTSQAIVNAIIHAMQWLQTASIDDLIKSTPASYYGAKEAEYRESLTNNIASFKWKPIVTVADTQRVLDTISLANPELKKNSKVDLASTYDNRLVEEALKKYPLK